MTIQQVIDMAANGELKSLSVATDTAAVLSFINLGMIELYKRFPLNVKEYIITLEEAVEVYTMPSDFMWLIAAYGEVPEDADSPVLEVAINEEDNPLSINTISWNQVQVPVTVTGAYISLIYVAAPPYYSALDLVEHISLPPQMLEAMLHYIGYRGHGSVTGELQAEHNTHYNRFEASCKRIEDRGMFTNDDMSMVKRVSLRGFA